MKAITIKQPWATLIALGEKQFETRSWQTKYRGTIAIHAGKSIDKDAFCYKEISETLKRHGISSINQLPTGCVLATANLTDCYKVLKEHFNTAETSGEFINNKEYWFGDYTEGRFAWKLEDINVLDKPILAKGQLSLWEWKEGH